MKFQVQTYASAKNSPVVFQLENQDAFCSNADGGVCYETSLEVATFNRKRRQFGVISIQGQCFPCLLGRNTLSAKFLTV